MAMMSSPRLPRISQLVNVGDLMGKPQWANVQAICHNLHDISANLLVLSDTSLTEE
jgi:hypothetical protein